MNQVLGTKTQFDKGTDLIKVSVERDMDKILNVLSLSILELNYEVIFTYEIRREGESIGLFPLVLRVSLNYLDIANRGHAFSRMGQFLLY